MIFSSVLEAVGKTPLIELKRLAGEEGLHARILAKAEAFNPGGSAKDRVALSMIRRAEQSGELQPGGTIIESTSGNTGIGLAMAGTVLGYHVILTMPETMSIERRKLLAAFGAEIMLTPGEAGMSGANKRAEELCAQIPNSIMASQFENPANPDAHYETTGPEILADSEGKIDAYVATIGTGGTLTGTGRYLKEQIPSIRIFGVEPAESPLITQGQSGPHGIQGIGANFIPAVFDRELCDKVLAVSTADAVETAKRMARREGILCGISSGAAVYAALTLAKDPAFSGKTIVVVLPDTGERYLSTELFS